MPPKGEMSELVVRVIREAKARTGKAPALAAKMAPYLGGFVYSESAISSWLTGRDQPLAVALLAAAKAGDVSLDALLFGRSMADQLAAHERRLAHLEGTETQDD